MLKRLLAVSAAAVVAVTGVSLTAAAENENKSEKKLPFELEAPSGVSLSWLGGESDSPTSVQAAYSMNNSMSEWLGKASDPNSHDATLEALLKDCGYNELWVNAQIDWAIDDKENGWHWTKYWDGETFTDSEGYEVRAGLGQDKEYHSRVSDWDEVEGMVYPQTQNDCWVLRSTSIYPDNPSDSEWFYGSEEKLGVKEQLKDDQYTLEELDPEEKSKKLVIDLEKHTAYIRVRWAVTMRSEDWRSDSVVFSDWSEPAGYGKDAEKFEPLTKETLKPPVITDLRYYEDEFNGYPQIACKLEVPDDLRNNISAVVANGGEIRIEWEARVPDGEWVGLQGGMTVTAGENIIALQNLGEAIVEQNKENGENTTGTVLEEGSPVELRARYWCNQYEGYQGEEIGEFYTDYSNVLTFGTQEMSRTEEPVPESSIEESKEPEKKDDKAAEKKCGLCGFCPQPLGLCIFIWIAIILAVIIIVVVVVIVVTKNKKKDDSSSK